MPSSDLERSLHGTRYATFSLGQPTVLGICVLTNVATTAVLCLTFPVPENCLLKNIGVSYDSATGTTPGLTVQVRRIAVSIGSATITGAGTAGTPIGTVSADLNVPLSKGEILNIATLATGNADNDFSGATVVLSFTPLLATS